MKEHNQKTVFRHLMAENAHDMEATLATLHELCVFKVVATGQTYQGRGGAREFYQLWWNAFDLQVEDDSSLHWIEDGNLFAQATFKGTHKGEFMGVEPTGRAFQLPFAVFVDFRDGLLLGEAFYFDLNTLWRQLEVEPPKGVAA